MQHMMQHVAYVAYATLDLCLYIFKNNQTSYVYLYIEIVMRRILSILTAIPKHFIS